MSIVTKEDILITAELLGFYPGVDKGQVRFAEAFATKVYWEAADAQEDACRCLNDMVDNRVSQEVFDSNFRIPLTDLIPQVLVDNPVFQKLTPLFHQKAKEVGSGEFYYQLFIDGYSYIHATRGENQGYDAVIDDRKVELKQGGSISPTHRDNSIKPSPYLKKAGSRLQNLNKLDRDKVVSELERVYAEFANEIPSLVDNLYNDLGNAQKTLALWILRKSKLIHKWDNLLVTTVKGDGENLNDIDIINIVDIDESIFDLGYNPDFTFDKGKSTQSLSPGFMGNNVSSYSEWMKKKAFQTEIQLPIRVNGRLVDSIIIASEMTGVDIKKVVSMKDKTTTKGKPAKTKGNYFQSV